MKEYRTEQEKFWSSQEWGCEYIQRNNDNLVSNNIKLFSDIFHRCSSNISTIIEFGSNIGLNLKAINTLLPNSTDISAIEINNDAVNELKKLDFLKRIYHDSILDIELKESYDFAFIKGVLIHINPDFLDVVYEKLYNCSNKYILIAEYYNPTPVMINYRGHENKLFKRDFAGEMLDKYKDLTLVDYGFVYHRDNNFPQDDITWFLLEK